MLNTPGTVVYGAKPLTQPEPADEKAFMAEVIAVAKKNGWKHMHHTISKKSVAGWPDLVLVRGKRTLFRELKMDHTDTTADQDGWIEALTDAEQDVAVWRPRDWPIILATLEAQP